MSTAKHPKLGKYQLIKSTSSRGTMWGYCVYDGAPIMLSDDKEVVLEHIYWMQHERKQYEPLTLAEGPSSHFGRERVYDEDYTADDAEGGKCPLRF
jgi:hypothetical protein